MKRRDFIKSSVPVSILPLLLGGYNFRAYGRSRYLEALVASGTETDHVLVIVQMNGGNDGLNTVIALDEYSALANARSNILLPENKVLKLTDATGLHPSMTGLQSLYIANKLCVVQGVTYPNPNFSHFRATDIWLSASDYNQIVPDGWVGRYLDQEYPDFPNGYPNVVMPDPVAIQIGSVISPTRSGSRPGQASRRSDTHWENRGIPGQDSAPPSRPEQSGCNRTRSARCRLRGSARNWGWGT